MNNQLNSNEEEYPLDMTDEEYRVQVSLGLLPSPQDIETSILSWPDAVSRYDYLIDDLVDDHLPVDQHEFFVPAKDNASLLAKRVTQIISLIQQYC